MLALALSVFLFLYFALIGQATLAAIQPRTPILKGWLLSPIVGISVTVLCVMGLNQVGLPVKNFAVPLGIVSAVVGVAVIWRRRHIFPIKALFPFVTAVLFSLAYTGWPALEVGFDWIAMGNDDMANYCLAAQRHLNFGFFRMPLAEELAGTDYSQYFWFMHVASMIRFGSELLIAWVAGVTKLTTLQSFMPLILTLSMAQVSATSALILTTSRRRRVAIASAFILAASPMFTFGTQVQLIAQVGGLALLITLCSISITPHPSRRFPTQLRNGILIGIIAAALCVFYPEVTPFAGLAYLIFVTGETIRRRQINRAWIVQPIVAGMVVLLLLRHNIFTYVVTLLNQTSSGTSETTTLFRFPYFLVPSGLGNSFGLLPLGLTIDEPLNSILIGVSGALLVLVALRCIIDLKKGQIYSTLLIVMLVLAALLFFKRSDFGLFKIVMFSQPIVACAVAWLFFNRNVWAGSILTAVLLFAQYPAAKIGALTSMGSPQGRVLELPGGSQHHLERPRIPDGSRLVSDFASPVTSKLTSLHTTGWPLYFLSYDYFLQLLGNLQTNVKAPTQLIARFHPYADEILNQSNQLIRDQRATIKKNTLFNTSFKTSTITSERHPNDIFLTSDLGLDMLNLNQYRLHNNRFFLRTLKRSELTNHLVFVPSSRGEHYYTLENPTTGAYSQVENDYFRPNRYFCAIGRFLLFRIENPSEQIYLQVNVTKSVMGSGNTRLDMETQALGQNSVKGALMGAGSASLYIGPISPAKLDGDSYVALDLGNSAQPIERPRAGLMTLYNQDIAVDWRRVSAYARNISAISKEDYERLERPRSLEHFPRDLIQSGVVEYSGWFEDGWLACRSSVTLTHPNPNDQLAIRGHILGVGELANKPQEMFISVNGAEAVKFSLPPGDFSINLPIADRQSITRVTITQSTEINLPAPDGRPVGAKIAFIGLTAN